MLNFRPSAFRPFGPGGVKRPTRYPEEYKEWCRFFHEWKAAEEQRRQAAARRIQSHWRRCVTDPSFAACRRRLMDEFSGLVAR